VTLSVYSKFTFATSSTFLDTALNITAMGTVCSPVLALVNITPHIPDYDVKIVSKSKIKNQKNSTSSILDILGGFT